MSSTPYKIVPGKLYHVASKYAGHAGMSYPVHVCDYGFHDGADEVEVFCDEVVLCLAVKPCTCTPRGYNNRTPYSQVCVMLAQNGVLETHVTEDWEEV